MSQQLAIFNPEHDLALANGSQHYMAPQSALQFASDCALLPMWLFPNAAVLCDNLIPDDGFWFLCEQLHVEPNRVSSQELSRRNFAKIEPWGWNSNLVNRIRICGIDDAVLPTNAQLECWRNLSHRRLTVDAMRFLRLQSRYENQIASIPQELRRIENVKEFVSENEGAILKMPWSGSGRGLRRIEGVMTAHQEGWAQQSIRKLGSVMCERYYFVVQDFAMEFACAPTPAFMGYSLFETQNGVYQQNLLMTDVQIEQRLAQWISIELLHECCSSLLTFISREIAPHYFGRVGVDMFVYQDDEGYKINPVVEFNLRNTMGMLAHGFYNHWVSPLSSGIMRMRYFADPNLLKEENDSLKSEYPLRIESHRISSGYLSLAPINEKTHYTVQIIIN